MTWSLRCLWGAALAGLLAVLLTRWGGFLLEGCLPMMWSLAELMQAHGRVILKLCDPRGEPSLCIWNWVLEPIAQGQTRIVSAHTRQYIGGMTQAHLLLPLVAYLSLVSAWPAASWRERTVRSVLSVVGAFAMLIGEGALQTAARIDMRQQDLVMQAGLPAPTTPLIWIDYFLETGGEWLLLVLVSAVTVRQARAWVGGQGPQQAGPEDVKRGASG